MKTAGSPIDFLPSHSIFSIVGQLWPDCAGSWKFFKKVYETNVLLLIFIILLHFFEEREELFSTFELERYTQ